MANLHGRMAAGVPTWAVLAAYATPLTVLPSGIWRILAVVANVPLLEHADTIPQDHGAVVFTGWWYAIVLTAVSEVLAYLTVGLVATWGEVVPRWVPWLGGRTIPVTAAVLPAGLAAAILTILWPYTFVMIGLGRMVNGAEGTGIHLNGWQAIAFIIAYGPLVAWGPLLGAVTIHYYRRRRGRADSKPNRHRPMYVHESRQHTQGAVVTSPTLIKPQAQSAHREPAAVVNDVHETGD